MPLHATNGICWPSIDAYREAAAAVVRDLISCRDNGPLQGDTIPLAAVVRNERLLIEAFLSHYRSLGVERFLIVDNGSTDGTFEFLAADPGVDLWRSTTSYATANQGLLWIDGLLRQRALDQWVLHVDIDEFLVFANMGGGGLRKLIRKLEWRGESRLFAPMLDVYSDVPIADTQINLGDDPLQVCNWFDTDRNIFENDERGVWIAGGPRRRLFFADVRPPLPGLSKFPLVRYDDETSFLAAHSPTPYERNFLKPYGCLLHVKLIARLAGRAAWAAEEKEYWNGAFEYQRYREVLSANPGLTAHYSGSLKYEGPESLIAAGLLAYPEVSFHAIIRTFRRKLDYWARLFMSSTGFNQRVARIKTRIERAFRRNRPRIKALEKRGEGLQRSLHRTQKQFDELQEKVSRSQQRLEELQTRLDRSQQRLAELEQVSERAKTQLESATQTAFGELCLSKLEPTLDGHEKAIARMPLAVYSCLPPADSGIADATWNTFRASPYPVHIYGSMLGLHDIVELQNAFERKNQHVLPIQSARAARLRIEYDTHLFVLGNSHHHIPAVEELGHASKERRSIVAHFHEPNMIGFWCNYFGNDTEALKGFLTIFYPELTRALRDAKNYEEVENAGCLGLRPFCKLFGLKRLIFNSEFARTLAYEDLGDNIEAQLEVLFLPIFEPRFSPLRPVQGKPLIVGHFGIPTLSKGTKILIDACEIISSSRPVELIIAGWHANSQVASMCPEPKPFITIVDRPNYATFLSLMDIVHVAVQLRPNAHGESSGAVHALLSRGKTIIVTGIGNFLDYENAVIPVSADITPDALALEILNNYHVDKRPMIKTILEDFSVDKFHDKLRDIVAAETLGVRNGEDR